MRQSTPSTPLPVNAPEPILRFVNLVAPEYKLAPQLVLAVMATESNFDPLAVSPKNAQGLMQLIPDTAARFNVRRISDPAQNIRGGMAYLRWLLAYFKGDLPLVLAAYNAGERAVDRYRACRPTPRRATTCSASLQPSAGSGRTRSTPASRGHRTCSWFSVSRPTLAERFGGPSPTAAAGDVAPNP